MLTWLAHGIVLLVVYGKDVRGKWKEKSDRILPIAVVLTICAVIGEIVQWGPAVLEPGGRYYAEFRHDGIVAIWAVGATILALGLYILFSVFQGSKPQA